MKKRTIVAIWYISAVMDCLIAIHPLWDKATHHDIWDTAFYFWMGVFCLSMGYLYSKQEDTKSNSDKEEKES